MEWYWIVLIVFAGYGWCVFITFLTIAASSYELESMNSFGYILMGIINTVVLTLAFVAFIFLAPVLFFTSLFDTIDVYKAK